MIRAVLALVLVLLPAAWQQPQKAVTVAVAQEPIQLFHPGQPAERLAASLVFDPLVGLDDRMQPYPVLAAEVPSLDNGLMQITGAGADRRLVVTMPLRGGVTWSDGEPFTADDVVYTWQLMENPLSGFDTSVEDKIRSVEMMDDLTVRFTYLSANEARTLDPARYRDQGTDPVVDPLAFFGLYNAFSIYPRHVLRQLVGDDPRHSREVAGLATSSFARNPVGTGPFVLSRWDAGTSLTFSARGEALPQRLRQPALDAIVFRVIPTKDASLTALQNTEVQIVAQDGLEATDAPVLDSLPGVQAFYTGGTALEQLTFNLDHPALGDPNVRRAIAFALDRQLLNETALAGKAEVPVTLVPGWSWLANRDAPTYPYDPSLANQVLGRAGWTRSGNDGIRQKDGRRLSLSLWSTTASFRPALLGSIRDQLAQVGIEVKVDFFPSMVFFDTRPSTAQALVARQFDLVEFAWSNGFDPGGDQMYTLHSRSVPSRANAYQGGNYANYRGARSDELLGQAQRSIDPGFRTAALGEAQFIWQTDLPALPLLVRPVVTAVRQGVLNFRPSPAPRGETWNAEQWDY